jgi:putative SOS response-associated peptidase YedK
MCGRYVSPDEASIEREFKLVPSEWQFPSSYNVAPTQSVPVIRGNAGTPQGSLMRWGLVPFFARGVPPTYSTINARVETVQTAASYRGPWSRGQRCLVVAQGFYEWNVLPDGQTKQPYYITKTFSVLPDFGIHPSAPMAPRSTPAPLSPCRRTS